MKAYHIQRVLLFAGVLPFSILTFAFNMIRVVNFCKSCSFISANGSHGRGHRGRPTRACGWQPRHRRRLRDALRQRQPLPAERLEARVLLSFGLEAEREAQRTAAAQLR